MGIFTDKELCILLVTIESLYAEMKTEVGDPAETELLKNLSIIAAKLNYQHNNAGREI